MPAANPPATGTMKGVHLADGLLAVSLNQGPNTRFIANKANHASRIELPEEVQIWDQSELVFAARLQPSQLHIVTYIHGRWVAVLERLSREAFAGYPRLD